MDNRLNRVGVLRLQTIKALKAGDFRNANHFARKAADAAFSIYSGNASYTAIPWSWFHDAAASGSDWNSLY